MPSKRWSTVKFESRPRRAITPASASEVWVVVPEGLTVEILYLEDGRLRRSQIPADDVLTSRHFPQVHIDIAGIWPD